MSSYASPLSSGKTSPKGFLRALGRFLTGAGVIESTALLVEAQGSPDMTVKVNGSSLDDNAVLIHTDGTLIQAWNEADLNVTIDPNVTGVTKKDAIVAYVDLADFDASNADNPDSFKFIAVRGSGTDTAPDNTQIRAGTVGATNPYIVLAHVTVANGAVSINSGNISDQRTRANLSVDTVSEKTAANGVTVDGLKITEDGKLNTDDSVVGSNLDANLSAGWIDADESWAYASATTITVPSDATTKYAVGDRIRLVQTTTKYFYVVGVSSTTLTITGGSDYTLVNAAITSPYYSKMATPAGFPQWFTYTVTYAGFSANPTHVARFSVLGRICYCDISGTANGTSNATNFTVSLPIVAATVTNMFWDSHGQGTDNGSGLVDPLLCRIASGGSVVTLGKNLTTLAGWTASGAKGADFTLWYEI